MRRKPGIFASAIALLLCVAAAVFWLSRSRSIVLPAGTVDRVEVRHSNGKAVTITDAKTIEHLIGFIEHRHDGWRKPWETFPTPEYSVVFESHGAFQYVIWIGKDGSNWIGFAADGRGTPDQLERELSQVERSELLNELKI